MELENRKAGKLPSVSGSGCMLGVGEFSETEQLNPPTTFKLFESENVTGPSGLIPQGPHCLALAERNTLTTTP